MRVKHSVLTKRGDQTLHLWHDVRRADRGHMELAFAQRRMRIVGDCHQLHSDVEWYNDHHPEADSIQLVLDFTPDVAELDAVIATDRTVAQVVRRDELDDDQNPELEPDPALQRVGERASGFGQQRRAGEPTPPRPSTRDRPRLTNQQRYSRRWARSSSMKFSRCARRVSAKTLALAWFFDQPSLRISDTSGWGESYLNKRAGPSHTPSARMQSRAASARS